MLKAIVDFGDKLSPDSVGLFHYAGHGVQFEGANYLVPTDASLGNRRYVRIEAVNANQVLERMAAAGNHLADWREEVSFALSDQDDMTTKFRYRGNDVMVRFDGLSGQADGTLKSAENQTCEFRLARR